jgi:poly(ADP-ribose) glycohydrolase ARH3
VVAEHLAQRGGSLDADAMAIVLSRHHGSGPTAEGFQGTRKAIPHPRGSLGNEAAVRATPIGLLPHTGIGTVAVIARRNAAVSHEHPLAQDGAAVHAVAVALAAHGQPAPAMDAKQFLATLVTQTRTPEFRSALGIVRMLARHRAGPAEIAATVGHDTSALRSVPAALAAYLRHPEDPAAAIRHAILIGGDTQAIAAMTGALAGARNPTFPAPAGWPGLADNVAISAAAEALAGVA